MWFLKVKSLIEKINIQILFIAISLLSFVCFSAFFNYSMLDNTEIYNTDTITPNPLIKDWSAHYTLEPKAKDPWDGWPEIPHKRAMGIVVTLHFICIFLLLSDSIDQQMIK